MVSAAYEHAKTTLTGGANAESIAQLWLLAICGYFSLKHPRVWRPAYAVDNDFSDTTDSVYPSIKQLYISIHL
jgi:hypothetical protein